MLLVAIPALDERHRGFLQGLGIAEIRIFEHPLGEDAEEYLNRTGDPVDLPRKRELGCSENESDCHVVH